MNILIPFEFNIKNGGAQKSIAEIIKNNTINNNFFALLPKNGDYDMYLSSLGVECYYAGNNDYWPAADKPIKALINVFRVSRKINDIIKEKKIEVIYCTMLPSILAATITKVLFKNNIKIIWHDRGTTNSKIFIIIIKLIEKYIDKIITTTNFGYNKILNYGINKSKVYMICNSTDFCNINKDYKKVLKQNDLKITLIARINKLKGQLEYIEIINNILNKNPDKRVSFDIVGDIGIDSDNEYMEEVKKLIDLYELNGVIKFRGNIDDINSYLKQIDLLFCTTGYPGESFGRVVIEAFSNKIPVVALNYGAISNVISDNIDGYLANDINEFADKALELIMNPEQRRIMGENGFNKTMEIYNSKLNNKKINDLLANKL